MTSLPLVGIAVEVCDLLNNQHLLECGRRDIELQDFVMSEVLGGDWLTPAHQARDLLSQHKGKIGVHGPSWGLDISNPDRDIQKITCKRIDTSLSICSYIGADQLVIHSPYSVWNFSTKAEFNSAPLLEWIVECCYNSLNACVKRAEMLGITIVIENIQDRDPFLCNMIAECFQSHAIALSVDTGHAHFAHNTFGGSPVGSFIAKAGSKIKHVHLHDNGGYADDHLSIGDGSICWTDVFFALERLQEVPRLILELNDKRGIDQSISYLKKLNLAK